MRKARIKLTYSEQLNDNRWHNKRNEIISKHKNKCYLCDEKTDIDVHHLYYENDGRAAWDYDDESMIPLCRPCHAKIHSEYDKITALISIQAIKKGMSFTDIAFKLGVL